MSPHSGSTAPLVLEAAVKPGPEGAPVTNTFARAFAERMMPARFESLNDQMIVSRFELAVIGPLALAETSSGYFRATTTEEQVRNAPPGLMLHVMLRGGVTSDQDGRSLHAEQSHIGMIHTQMPAVVTSNVMQRSRLVVLPEPVLGPAVGDIARLAGGKLDRRVPEAGMLASYLSNLDIAGLSAAPALGEMVARQLAELLAAALAREAGREDPTEGRGLRAARLAEVKRIISSNIENPMLNADRVGRMLGVSGRYVQKLMDEDGATFSGYVMESRLSRAFAELSAAEPGGPSVAAIAAGIGFSDPSHFSRAFRRRFGTTPNSVRGTAA